MNQTEIIILLKIIAIVSFGIAIILAMHGASNFNDKNKGV